MVREKVTVSTRTLQWKCVESRTDSKRLYYGRFILSPLMKGQADTIGIAMRRALLGEIEGTCITRVKFESEKIQHEYSTVGGIQESLHEILMNLKEIVLRSNIYGTCHASICVKGPGYVTAQDIILPPCVEIVDNTQHIANLTEPIDLCIELQIEKNRGYLVKTPQNFQDGSYPIDAVFLPVRNANHSIHSYGNGNEKQEILFLEIWTNGSLTPKEALHEASRNLIDLFIPFLHMEEENVHFEANQHKVSLSPFLFDDKLAKLKKNKYKKHGNLFLLTNQNCFQGSIIASKGPVQYIYINIGPFEKQSRRSYENCAFSHRRCKTDIGHSIKPFCNCFTKK
uniref:DNA-directed RNA polymerase n=1 Tax=Onosma fuyunensis TaxID=2742969 RepID=A0A6M9QEM9_9BORA|nr:RNA polymerase alpha subunit [Onosma fuyunensis]QKM77460.1 RNA polymerase alpha subunit [Onosma fuyunensis]